MIQAWQKRLLSNRKHYYKEIISNEKVTLDAGQYYLKLSGGGASGVGYITGITADSYAGVAQGGTGGMLGVLVNLRVQTELNITIGQGGAGGRFYGINTGTHYGNAGGDTIIAGIPGGDIKAGGGVPPYVVQENNKSSIHLGRQGVNSYGDVISVLWNNNDSIVPMYKIGRFRAGPYIPERLLNSDLLGNTEIGSGGANGWQGPQKLLAIAGYAGKVIISTEW